MELLFYDTMGMFFGCYVCVLSTPIVFLAINVALLSHFVAKMDVRGMLHVNGLIYAASYIIFIQIPYYFMGYKELTIALPGEGLGITADLPPFSRTLS